MADQDEATGVGGLFFRENQTDAQTDALIKRYGFDPNSVDEVPFVGAEELNDMRGRIMENYGFDPYEIARQEGINPFLILRVIYQESRGIHSQASEAGASGLMQLMPGTAEEMGVDRNDPEDNVRGGARYLRKQLNTFESIPLALAAYNAGPGNVRRSEGVPPFEETQKYLKGIIASLDLHYGLPEQAGGPEVPTPGVPTPGVPTPGVPTPGVPTPRVPTPRVPTPEETEGATPEVPEQPTTELLGPSWRPPMALPETDTEVPASTSSERLISQAESDVNNPAWTMLQTPPQRPRAPPQPKRQSEIPDWRENLSDEGRELSNWRKNLPEAPGAIPDWRENLSDEGSALSNWRESLYDWRKDSI